MSGTTRRFSFGFPVADVGCGRCGKLSERTEDEQRRQWQIEQGTVKEREGEWERARKHKSEYNAYGVRSIKCCQCCEFYGGFARFVCASEKYETTIKTQQRLAEGEQQQQSGAIRKICACATDTNYMCTVQIHTHSLWHIYSCIVRSPFANVVHIIIIVLFEWCGCLWTCASNACVSTSKQHNRWWFDEHGERMTKIRCSPGTSGRIILRLHGTVYGCPRESTERKRDTARVWTNRVAFEWRVAAGCVVRSSPFNVWIDSLVYCARGIFLFLARLLVDRIKWMVEYLVSLF